ncbi:MAG: glycine cleavage system H protein [Bradymonadia bacterium]|jgi:glycine cleavage system H protein
MSDSKIPADLKYTAEHEWTRVDADGLLLVGITDFAQDALGDVTYLELPDAGAEATAGEPFGVVESVKTFSDLYSPVDGEIVEVNAELVDAPEGMNEDPYGAWLVKIKLADASSPDGLMSPDDYKKLIAEQE